MTEVEAWLALHPKIAAVMIIRQKMSYEAHPIVGGVLLEANGNGLTIKIALAALGPKLPSKEAMP